MIGVYCYTNNVNGKKYIGKSINIENRIENHKYRFDNKNDSGYNTLLHCAFREFGYDAFTVEILCECGVDDLTYNETKYMVTLNTFYPNGYNKNRSYFLLDKNTGKYVSSSQKTICPLCGKEKSHQSQLCKSCRDLNKTSLIGNIDESIYLELINRVLNSSYEKVAKEIGYTSGNAIKKRIKKSGFSCDKKEIAKYYEQVTGTKHQSVIEDEQRKNVKDKNREKIKPKTVLMYDADGNLLKKYPSTHAAIRDGFRSGHISECCRGKRKNVKGYIFKYAIA